MRALFAALLLSFAAQAQEVVVLVRHAEKVDESKNPKLSTAGEARAKALAAKLKDAGITSIWTSEFIRTQETAKPLADALGLTLKVHPAKDSKGLIELLRKEGGRALVVGHSNTVGEIARMYGGKVEDLRDDEYDALLVGAAKGEGFTFVKLRQ
ncbi:MAG TPA: histidine phosphatase family protein [Myxococcales bacterium]|nr:histidine phosphatase family protein [Myxococcales bacterium]